MENGRVNKWLDKNKDKNTLEKIGLSTPPASGLLLNFAALFGCLFVILKTVEISMLLMQHSHKSFKKLDSSLVGSIADAFGGMSLLCFSSSCSAVSAISNSANHSYQSNSTLDYQGPNTKIIPHEANILNNNQQLLI